MKKIIYLLLILPFIANGQYNFVYPSDSPGSGTVHINDGRVGDSFQDINRAVFKFGVDLYSTGRDIHSTGCLINQNTSDGIPKQYFVSSKHCFTTGDCTGSEFDYAGKTVNFYFNFQSPKDNLGKVFKEIPELDGYKFTSKIRKIADVSCAYGDFFLGEILDPIPPHFNVYYAGWTTQFGKVDNFSNISHPNSSLKSFANTSYVFDGYLGSVAQTSCNLVAQTIDKIVCIRKCKKSSAQLCQYVSVPYVDQRYVIKYFNNGKLYGGSSGSPLLNGNKQIIGNLSGGKYGDEWFGKFKSYYYNGNIRGNLNPQYDWVVDLVGVSGVSRNVFENIDYNHKDYNLYPAKLFQKENTIQLTAKNDVNLGDFDNGYETVIKEQASYVFSSYRNSNLGKATIEKDALLLVFANKQSNIQAVSVNNGARLDVLSGEKISLKSGFKVEKGGSFSARVAQFTIPSSQRKIAAEEQEKMDLFARMQSIQIPSSYDITSELLANQMFVELMPNPASEVVSLKFGYLPQDHLKITVLNAMGQNMFVQEFKGINSNAKLDISLDKLEAGIYQFILDIGDSRVVKKIAIEK